MNVNKIHKSVAQDQREIARTQKEATPVCVALVTVTMATNMADAESSAVMDIKSVAQLRRLGEVWGVSGKR